MILMTKDLIVLHVLIWLIWIRKHGLRTEQPQVVFGFIWYRLLTFMICVGVIYQFNIVHLFGWPYT